MTAGVGGTPAITGTAASWVPAGAGCTYSNTGRGAGAMRSVTVAGITETPGVGAVYSKTGAGDCVGDGKCQGHERVVLDVNDFLRDVRHGHTVDLSLERRQDAPYCSRFGRCAGRPAVLVRAQGASNRGIRRL